MLDRPTVDALLSDDSQPAALAAVILPAQHALLRTLHSTTLTPWPPGKLGEELECAAGAARLLAVHAAWPCVDAHEDRVMFRRMLCCASWLVQLVHRFATRLSWTPPDREYLGRAWYAIGSILSFGDDDPTFFIRPAGRAAFKVMVLDKAAVIEHVVAKLAQSASPRSDGRGRPPLAFTGFGVERFDVWLEKVHEIRRLRGQRLTGKQVHGRTGIPASTQRDWLRRWRELGSPGVGDG